MGGFISKLLEPFRSRRVVAPVPRPHTPTIEETPVSRPHTPTVEENDEQDTCFPARIETAEGTEPKKLSARQRLDGLSSYRIHSSALIFAPERSHGSGGKGDVVRATFRRESASEEQVVAVKKLRYHEGINQKKFSNEFVHEVEITAGLAHDNIVKLVGFVEDLEDGKAWIVLSWAPNGNVNEFLATGTWEIPERVSLITDTFEGVKYLHTRQPPICHGDLKSLNILVSSSYRAIITDFGSARAITESEGGAIDEELAPQAEGNPTTEQTHPQIYVTAVGNQLTLTGPAWSLRSAPPEVLDGERPSLSTDVWAAGWIAWEVMTGKVPFHEANSVGAIILMVIQGEVPVTREDAQLAQIITLCSLMKDCWAFDPKARPNIARCCSDLQWIPSIPPSSGKDSDHGVPSAELLLKMGEIHYGQARPEKATLLFQEALSLARSAGDQSAAANALEWLGDAYRVQSKYTQAEESYIQAQEIYTRVGDDRGRANIFEGLGDVYRVQSKYTQAEEWYTRAQEAFAHIGHEIGRANTLDGLGDIYIYQSKYTQAEESYTRAHEIYTRIGNDRGRANTLLGLGHAYRRQSKHAQAEEPYTRAQETYARIGDDLGRANVLRGLGDLCRDQGRHAEAALYYAEAKDIYAQVGSTRSEKETAERLAALSPNQNSATP